MLALAFIQKGTAGDAIASQQLVRATPILATHVSAGALSDAGSLRGMVAARDILPGQQLTSADFAGGGGIAAQLAPNERAVSVALDAAHGLTGVVQAGDRVDVYVGFTVQQVGVTQAVQVIRLLIPGALVLRSPGSGSSGLGSSGTSGNVVLEVSDGLAPHLAYAADNGKIWLVLRPANAATPDQDITTLDSLLLGHIGPGSFGGSPVLPAKSTLSLGGH